MTIIFNIPYNDTYSSKISFETKMNEKATGNEQRYPVKTFPVRYFTLNFNKAQEAREALEAFFVECMGQGNQFQQAQAQQRVLWELTLTQEALHMQLQRQITLAADWRIITYSQQLSEIILFMQGYKI